MKALLIFYLRDLYLQNVTCYLLLIDTLVREHACECMFLYAYECVYIQYMSVHSAHNIYIHIYTTQGICIYTHNIYISFLYPVKIFINIYMVYYIIIRIL